MVAASAATPWDAVEAWVVAVLLVAVLLVAGPEAVSVSIPPAPQAEVAATPWDAMAA